MCTKIKPKKNSWHNMVYIFLTRTELKSNEIDYVEEYINPIMV
jgi:hypothetical protein